MMNVFFWSYRVGLVFERYLVNILLTDLAGAGGIDKAAFSGLGWDLGKRVSIV